MLFASGRRAAAGGLASMLDSGGMREQMIDLAVDLDLRFADIGPQTVAVLREHLETGLDAVNPMDGMGALGRDSAETFLQCGKALLDDPDSGLLSFEFEFRDDFSHYPELFDVARRLAEYSNKPVVLVNSCSFSRIADTAAELTREGIPVVNGIDLALRALSHLMQYRSERECPQGSPHLAFNRTALDDWRQRLAGRKVCSELESLELMATFGLPTIEFSAADSLDRLLEAASTQTYPLVLKTAADGIAHKSELNGVRVNLRNQLELEEAYHDLQQTLGNEVVLMPMIEDGVEVSLGMKYDPQFGPLVVVACGGVMIELLAERSYGLAPLGRAKVEQMLDRIRLGQLLAGYRGQAAVDRAGLVDLIQHFSELALAFDTAIGEIDLNPVIVNQSGCTIVDALVVPRPPTAAR